MGETLRVVAGTEGQGLNRQRWLPAAGCHEMRRARTNQRPIVTEIAPLVAFYDAEPYHQAFAARNARHPDIVIHDLPKIARLRERFPARYRAEGR